jgi:ectoine hydroxylase-related dioxygenase (phytanoyl-CoA dioxygenase family)
MITRRHGNLRLRSEPAPLASAQLERDGFVVLRGVIEPEAVRALRNEIAEVFANSPPDRSHDTGGEYRHAMFNRSALSQKAVSAPAILEAIEPVLGEDCHVIANTAWRNLPGRPAGRWHIDAGPHVPRAAGVVWPDEIPYPVFAIGMHLFLDDCPKEAGPTAVVPGSHRSGSTPPWRQEGDPDPIYEGRGPELLIARAGDAALFVSDVWHQGTAAEAGWGRFFLQAHYARRDISQRLLMSSEMSQVSPEAAGRAQTPRERTLIGLHDPFFYDS